MAISRGPKLVTNGLVLALDASDDNSFAAQNLPIKNGLLLWLDAADDDSFVYSSGTFVSQWRDKSGLNNHANQATVANQPNRNATINSRKTITLDGTNDYFDGTSNLNLSNGYCAFVIIKSSATGERDIITSNPQAQSTDLYLYQRASDGKLGNWSEIYTINPISIGTWYLLSVNINSSGAEALYLNGTLQGSSTRTLTNTKGYRIGVNSSGAEFWNGEIAEIIIFGRELSTTELKKVHTHLGQKWGISNTDRQIFDLSGNNFNFSFNGPNPRYNAKTIVSNFDTSSPYTVSAFGGQNLTSTVLNLLYLDHTIEVAVNPKGFRSVYSYNNALTTQTVQGIVLWTGQHSGLYFQDTTLYYLYWNTTSTTVSLSYNAASYQDKIMYITATRTGDVLRLYINGVLVAGPTTVAASTSPISYSQINIGTAYQGNPTTQGYVWAGQHEYHLLRMYSRRLTDTEVVSNYQAFKARFDNNIVRYGLILDLDAGNPYSYAGAGTTWYDVSGNARNATVNGAITFSDNYFNTGSTGTITNYITIPSAALNSLTSWTIQLWLNINSTNSIDTFLTCGAGNDFLWFFDGRSNLAFQNTSSSSIPYPTTIGEWFLFTATGTGGSISVYKNGSSLGSFSNTTSITVNSAFGIVLGQELDDNTTGAFDATQAFLGKYGSVSFYNRVLSAAEVLQNYNATKGRFGL